MIKLTFEDLEFEEKDGFVRVNFLRNFFFDVERSALNKLGYNKAHKNEVEFKDKDARKKFDRLLDAYMPKLRSKITHKPAFYIHSYSGIPLIGSNSFGLVDRNTTLIEVKPVTGCNLNCIYCSVDEGLSTKKVWDYVVEEEYVVDEFKKLVAFKSVSGIEAHIGVNGEPLIYSPLLKLIKDLAAIPEVAVVSMDTNGVLLTKDLVDELAKIGKVRINLSLNALEPKLAKRISGCGKYDVEQVIKVAEYASKKMDLLIAPVLIPDYNEKEIGKLVEFAKKIGAKIGIQNFLNYHYGRNPAKAYEFGKFYELIRGLESRHNAKLVLGPADFGIRKTKKLPKPFVKGDIVKAVLAFPGRLPDEEVAIAKGRTILVRNCKKAKGEIRIKITRSKHNIFVGIPV
jgi:hypothetical protein